MTQMKNSRRRPSSPTFPLVVIALIVGLLAGAALSLAISRIADQVTSDSQPALTTQAAIHQYTPAELPDPAFTGMVLGYGTDFQPQEALRLADIAVDVCTQLRKDFTYQSIREGLEAVYGFSHGEAGILISATRLYECE